VSARSMTSLCPNQVQASDRTHPHAKRRGRPVEVHSVSRGSPNNGARYPVVDKLRTLTEFDPEIVEALPL